MKTLKERLCKKCNEELRKYNAERQKVRRLVIKMVDASEKGKVKINKIK